LSTGAGSLKIGAVELAGGALDGGRRDRAVPSAGLPLEADEPAAGEAAERAEHGPPRRIGSLSADELEELGRRERPPCGA
jgi:hypothetical protein